ncbi:TAXI family TRAP transporter solute-binding subunit [Chloroflexota bacterium]
MKRHIYYYIVALMIISLVSVAFGCAEQAPAPAPTPAPKPAPAPATPSDLAVGTKFMPSTTYVSGVAVVKTINKHVEGITAHVASYPTDSIYPDAYAAGRLDLSIGSSSTTIENVFGMGKWKDRGAAPMRQIGIGDPVFLGVLAHPNSGINTPADLKGKKWMIIRPGSALLRTMADAIMYGYGLTENDVDVLEHSSSKEMTDALKEGRVDAIGWPYYKASPWVEELAMAGKVKIISDTPEGLQKIMGKYPQFMPMTLQAGLYKGQDKEVKTFGIYQTLDCSADLSADVVYAVTTALFNNYEEWLAYHSSIGGYRLPGGIDVEKIGIPIHEGAIRYYKEKGLWTAAHEAKQKELLEKVKAAGPFKPKT